MRWWGRTSPSIPLAPRVAGYRLPALLRAGRAGMAVCLCFGLLGTGCVSTQTIETQETEKVAQTPDPQPNPMFHVSYSASAEVPFVMESGTPMPDGAKGINFQSASASRRTRDVANWVFSSSDHRNMPFAIVDKLNARTYIFGADGQLRGAAPVLIGLAKGDHSVPGIGDMPMSRMPPEYRTTPAGRFVARMGHNSRGKEILWVDYETAISMHPVITSNPEERRPQRLATPTPRDNRISYGCINVPAEFFKNVVQQTFSGTAGIVYILPETDLPIQNTRLSEQQQ